MLLHPLPQAALDPVLEQMRAQMIGALVFPGLRAGVPMSDMTLVSVLRRMGHGDVVPHGFRSTFRDWAGECTAYPRELAEVALAHSVGDDTERAYQRGDFLLIEKRRRLMRDWAQWSATPAVPATVRPIRHAEI
jgi:integrase